MDMVVIGGPDGPTVILVGGDPAGLILTLVLAAAVIGAAVWLFRRKRKQ